MLVIDENGLHSSKPFEKKPLSVCTFEHVYFSRPDSTIFGRSVNESRHKMGKQLAIEHPVDADLVVPVPDSGVAAAIGYATPVRHQFSPGDHPQSLRRPHVYRAVAIDPLVRRAA